MSLTSPIFLSSVPMTSVPLNFEARNWSGDCLVTNLSAATAPVEAGAFAVVDALGVDVEALGEVVLGEAFGVEGVLVAAGGGDVDGEVLGAVEVCASALVNANVLTAATAMTCFNMSASWGDCVRMGLTVAVHRRPAWPTRGLRASSGFPAAIAPRRLHLGNVWARPGPVSWRGLGSPRSSATIS